MKNELKYRFSLLSASEKLIAVMLLFFFFPFLVRTLLFLVGQSFNFIYWFELYPSWDVLLLRPWTLLTYAFFHGSIGHLFWNMVLLYFSGRLFLNLLNTHTFYNLFFLGVMAGGLSFVISYTLFPVFWGQNPPLIGSSAGVMAVLIFVCATIPQQEVRLLFFPIKLWVVGALFVAIDLVQIPSGNAGGHLAHLGGAALGYLYQKQLQKGHDIGKWFGICLENILKYFKPSKSKMKPVHRSPKRTSTHKADLHQERIDEILDKISKSGYESLTRDEKDFLFQAGKK